MLRVGDGSPPSRRQEIPRMRCAFALRCDAVFSRPLRVIGEPVIVITLNPTAMGGILQAHFQPLSQIRASSAERSYHSSILINLSGNLFATPWKIACPVKTFDQVEFLLDAVFVYGAYVDLLDMSHVGARRGQTETMVTVAHGQLS
jgi:hypothetical protein